MNKTENHITNILKENMSRHYTPVLLDLRKSICSDRMLSRLVDSGNIIIHNSLGYPVAKYINTNIIVGIEPLNPMIRKDLTLGYIVVVRKDNVYQEVTGLLNMSLPKAILIFKDYIHQSIKSKMQ